MKILKLFKFQLNSFVTNVILFQGKDHEYKILGIAAWIAFLVTIWFGWSIFTNIIN